MDTNLNIKCNGYRSDRVRHLYHLPYRIASCTNLKFDLYSLKI